MSATGQTAPALMHFPLAEAYAFYGRRIRRAGWSELPPDSITDATPQPTNPVRWFSYVGGLWFVTSWRIAGGKVEQFERVVEAADFTKQDMLAWDWTTLGPECDVTGGDCQCSGNAALYSVPPFREDSVSDSLSGGTFDLRYANTHMGDFGCELPPADPRQMGGGNCSCATATMTPSATGSDSETGTNATNGQTTGTQLGGGGSTGGSGSGSAGGGGSGSGSGGGGSGGGDGNGSGSGGGGGGGGGGGRPWKPPKPLATSASCSLDMTRERDSCYSKTDYTANPAGTADVTNRWFGHLTLNDPNDDGRTLWFYKVVFQTKVLISGTMKPGDNVAVDTDVVTAEPGQSFGMVATCHKPFGESCSDDYECVFPDWCSDPSRSGSSGSPARSPSRSSSGGGGSSSGGNYVPPP